MNEPPRARGQRPGSHRHIEILLSEELTLRENSRIKTALRMGRANHGLVMWFITLTDSTHPGRAWPTPWHVPYRRRVVNEAFAEERLHLPLLLVAVFFLGLTGGSFDPPLSRLALQALQDVRRWTKQLFNHLSSVAPCWA
jgi:hypothetical protein